MESVATSPALQIALSAAFGLIIGSFLNVVIHRLPLRASLVTPGSSCPGCGASIRWWNNIPVLSYVLLRGRCAACGKGISPRYPAVELLTAFLFVAAYLHAGPGLKLFLRDWPLLASCIAVVFIDLEHRIIPDRLNLFLAALGIATAGLDPELGWYGAILGGTVGFGMFYGFAWLYHAVTGRSGLGGGDIKFLGAAGLFLGTNGVFWTILISSIVGSVWGIGYALVKSHGREDGQILKVALPYGPFLVLGAIFCYFFGNSEWLRFTTPT